MSVDWLEFAKNYFGFTQECWGHGHYEFTGSQVIRRYPVCPLLMVTLGSHGQTSDHHFRLQRNRFLTVFVSPTLCLPLLSSIVLTVLWPEPRRGPDIFARDVLTWVYVAVGLGLCGVTLFSDFWPLLRPMLWMCSERRLVCWPSEVICRNACGQAQWTVPSWQFQWGTKENTRVLGCSPPLYLYPIGWGLGWGCCGLLPLSLESMTEVRWTTS